MIAVVTGASSGIGYEVCRILHEEGHTVYGLSRRGTAPEGVYGISVDIMDSVQVEKSIHEIIHAEGHIDYLVNNAGMGISGPVEFASKEKIEHILQVNLLGAIRVTQAVLPFMREKGSGHIVFVSSVAGEIAIPYQALYSASKAALTSLSLALRNEVREFGIRISVVEPGDAHTGFTDAREKEETYNTIYAHNKTATAAMEKDERNGMSPGKVAGRICKVLLKNNPKPVYIIGLKYQFFCLLFRLLPARLAYWIVGKMYG